MKPNLEAKRSKIRLLDRLIPAVEIDSARGAAFFAHARHKTVVVDGRAACPLMDFLIQRQGPGGYTHVVVGQVPVAEAIPGYPLPQRLRWGEFLASLLFWNRTSFADFRFLWRLMTARLVGLGRNHRVHAIRSYFVARYFALKFRKIAAACDRAYVICYYDAVMLGVVAAFRRAGKEVWDVQHGNLGPTHDSYNNRSAFSVGSDFTPTGFVVWSRDFGEHIERTLHAKWESTEYAHLKAFERSTTSAADPSRMTILYTLQPGAEEPFPAEVAEAIRRFTSVQWRLRPHPRQGPLSDEIEQLARLPHVTIVSGAEPLIGDLQASGLHITYNSSVVHEAAALGKMSLYLDPKYIDRFDSEKSRGLAFFVPREAFVEHLAGVLAGMRNPDASAATPVGDRPLA